MIRITMATGNANMITWVPGKNTFEAGEHFVKFMEKSAPGKLVGASVTVEYVGPDEPAETEKKQATHKVQAHVTGLNFGARYKLLKYVTPGLDRVYLTRDTDNEAHENAIEVLDMEYGRWGFLRWDEADQFAGFFAEGETKEALIVEVDCTRPGSMTVEFEVPYNQQ